MDDDRKKSFRGKSPRPTGASRPAKGGDGGKRFRKDDAPRAFAKSGDRPARSGDGPAGERKPFRKREFSAAARPEGQTGERPARKFDSERPARKFDGESPARKFDGERPARKFDGERPARKFDGERPARKFDGERPARKFDGERPARKFDGERPARKFDGDRPPRKFDGERPARKFDGDRPPRKFDDRRPDSRSEPVAAEEGERIAKRLARAGISSRRDAEQLIASGRVRVNGKVLESPAFNVGANDKIEVDGTEIPAIERTRLFLFNKPAGLVTTNRDPEGRRTIFDALPEGLPRLLTVGRLDINTEGLLLLTNDGGLSRIMELPATGWLRRYRVRVHGAVDEKALEGLKDGIAVDGVFYGAVEAALEREQGTNAWLSIGLREGKNREVKNILGALGLEVNRLIRISYGPFQLGELPEGHVLEIKGRTLREQLGERLIEESGANFEADIAKPFSNKPVGRGGEARSSSFEPRPPRSARPVVEKEGGLIKNFRRDKDRQREDRLDRLSTRPERGGRSSPEGGFRSGPRSDQTERKPRGPKPEFGGGRRSEREEAPPIDPGNRRANVWMAPGARPQGKRPSERAADNRSKDGAGGRFKPSAPRGDHKGGKPSGAGRPRSGGPRGPKGPKRP